MKFSLRAEVLCAAASLVLVVGGCGGNQQLAGNRQSAQPTPSPTATPIPTPSPSATPTPTPNPSPSPSPTATPTPSPSPSPTPTATPSPTPAAVPAVDHVFLVMLENHGFAQVIGSPAMPYLNSLASQHALATQYFANSHPSIGNYFMLTTGNLETTNDNFTGTITDDNLVRAFLSAGKTWKAYIQSLPSPGYLGSDVYPYLKHHVPFVYFSDVKNSSVLAANIVPLTQLASDLSANATPNFAYLLPNAENDAHDCPAGAAATCPDSDKLAAADNWLKANLDPLITNPALANSVFIVLFDEALDSDVTHGGGRVAEVLVGAHVKPAFTSTTLYQHQSTLRLILELLSVSDRPGLSATASDMGVFFQ
ncbi:MAG TPA: alkaline phosphatase family protein [Candidatus Acidoferrales bacterium]|nr:alkaline phosphatase family protein [Candidatus Acidoferrales bacterium]